MWVWIAITTTAAATTTTIATNILQLLYSTTMGVDLC